ncbi:MAG: DUF1214 domain-containing protein [Bacteroidota bacterium]
MRGIRFILILIVGLVAGAGAAIVAIHAQMSSMADTFRNGQWQYFPSMDLEVNPVLRAAIARSALFAVRESEVLYFLLDKDDQGLALSSHAVYELKGRKLQSRYWSICLYGEDHFLVDNSEDRYSYNQENIQYTKEDSSAFLIRISARPQAGNWLPSGEEETFSLILRLYHPDPSVYQNIATTSLPTLKKVSP